MGKPLRRGGRYSTRRRIPTDLVTAYGRKEIVIALNTADPTEGNRLNRLMWVKLDEEFAAKRAELAAANDAAGAQSRQAAALKSAPLETRIAAAIARLRKAHATVAAQGEEALADWAADRRRELRWHQAVLSGSEPPEFSYEGHEVGRNALRAVLEGEGPAAFAATGNLPDFAGALTLGELQARRSGGVISSLRFRNPDADR